MSIGTHSQSMNVILNLDNEQLGAHKSINYWINPHKYTLKRTIHMQNGPKIISK